MITVSHRTPTGPDVSWTVPGLTQAELEGYDAWAGVASPAMLPSYLWVEGIDGYVVATDRERDGWDPQLHLAAPIDGFLDDCFVEPLTRATLDVRTATSGTRRRWTSRRAATAPRAWG
ncbi:MAG: hypothetical protein H6738_13220 [Alphaproteobacteria bacterium]|nr:hypothetical protein [Alphaproteobacteria bacterium]MCB9697737.1 hypothetical protein [Alphaproteobacteria bacterium]